VEFRILGPVEVLAGGHPVPVNSGRHRTLLAALLLRANRPAGTGYLIRQLWNGDGPVDARGALQVCVMRLRRVLGDRDATLIRTCPDGYSIAVQPHQLDLLRFSELLDAAAAATDPDVECTLLTEALALWRGPALADVPSESLRRGQVPRLTERWLQARERLVDVHLLAGRHLQVIPELQQLTREHPLRERAWAQLMTALYRAGRQAEALGAYQAVVAHLREELGIDPGQDLRDLQRHILTGDPSLAAPPRPATVLPAVPRQLPAAVPGFVGRTAQLAMLDGLLADRPAVSVLVGGPGVGKTALAVHWARRVAGSFPDGQLYLDLNGFAAGAPLTTADALGRLLRGLGVRPDGIPAGLEERSALYRSLLAGRAVLVLLDDAASADQVRPLLPGEPAGLVLVTSRNRMPGLAVSHGAMLLALDLLTPAESRSLLCRQLGPGPVAADPAAVDDLAALCGRLPLALRIAAANLAAAPSSALRSHLARLRSGDLLPMLAVAGDPQAAVLTSFERSYAALTAAERRIFRQLGLIRTRTFGGSTVAALAGTTTEETERLLDGLVRASLLDRGRDGRFSVPDLLHRYAAYLCRSSEPDADGLRRPLDAVPYPTAPWFPLRAVPE
jgi:DNA-binding SARP family transcriptional activator